jgi:hypothetical protein
MTQHTIDSGLFALLGAFMLCGCADKHVTYQAHVKPILDRHCVACHVPGGSGYQRSGVRLDTYDAIMTGTRFGAIVQPGSSVSSVLYRLLSGQLDPSIRMPHGQAGLTDTDVALVGTWIDQGAME